MALAMIDGAETDGRLVAGGSVVEYTGGSTGVSLSLVCIDGIGAGYVVPLWRREIADRIEQVSTEDAVAMALRLAREEGLFAGTSTGANVIAALRLAEGLGPDATVVTVMCDTGMKYLEKFGAGLRA